MKVGITGGAGFIGRYVVEEAVRRGWDVFAFDRASGNDIMGDITELKTCDTVIHLAGVLGTAELFDTAEEAVSINVIGSLRIIELCAENGIQYTGISMPPVFPSVYTATKVCTGRLATAYHISKSLRTSHVRAFNAYGAGQAHGPGHPQKIVPTFATLAWDGQPIPVWGDGEQTVDLVHARDLGRMLIDASEYGDDAYFDGGTGVPFTVNEVAEMVLRITGSDAGIKYLPMRDGETPTHIVAEGEGWDKLGWKPEFDADDFRQAVYAYMP